MDVENLTGEKLRTQRFQMLQDIAEEFSGDINFPTSFDLSIRLRDVLEDPNWTLEKIASVISVEPLISARLMGLANSVAFNATGPQITDIKTAVVRLGLNLVRSTALAIAVDQMLHAKSVNVFKDHADWLWNHSMRTASAAYVLSKHYSSHNPDEAMLTGMIHDIGAFYMLYRASQYDELRARPDTVKYLSTQWHEHIGYTLLDALGMPDVITQAIREHDLPRPVPAKFQSLGDIIYVANLLAGGAEEWRFIDSIADDQIVTVTDEKYTGLSDEIDSYEQQIRTVFS